MAKGLYILGPVDIGPQVAMVNESFDLLLQREETLYVIPVLFVEMVVLHHVHLGPLSYLPELVENVLVHSLHQNLPQQSELIIIVMMRAFGTAVGFDFVTLLLGLRRRKWMALLKELALSFPLPLLYHAFFNVDIFLGMR